MYNNEEQSTSIIDDQFNIINDKMDIINKKLDKKLNSSDKVVEENRKLKSINKKNINEINKLKAEIKKTNNKLIFYKNELKIYEDSISYRVGKFLIDCVKNPFKLLFLPFVFIKFIYEGLKFIFGRSSLFNKFNFKKRNKNKKNNPKNKALKEYSPKLINGKSQIEVDIVVCVHNALEDVKECLNSLFNKQTIPFNLIIVDDGSKDDTKKYLESFSNNVKCKLFRNEIAQGYTIAANIGLRNSTGDYVVLLNSDTIVTDGWLEKMISCAKVDKDTGIVGPLSNAASWQTVPEVMENGDWKVNTLPSNINLDLMGQIVEEASIKEYPIVPFVNGFCFMISRKVINTIGILDEETFPKGYGEENDYCIRAIDAGFKLRVADDTYIFHEKSKSFSHKVRKQLSPKAGQLLKQKHSTEKVNNLINQIKYDVTFKRIRERISDTLDYFNKFNIGNNVKIGFILTAKGGGGGVNSVVQETKGLRKFGLDVKILNLTKYKDKFLYFYPDAEDYTEFYSSKSEIAKAMKNYHMGIATVFTTVTILKAALNRNKNLIPLYYAQDYEVLFFDKDHHYHKEAYDSYTAINKNSMFAKTYWIIEQIEQEHKRRVTKVQPSVDLSTYNPYLNLKYNPDKIIRISAMVRPSTPRRSPAETVQLMREIKDKYKNKVKIMLFGCTENELMNLNVPLDFEYSNFGVIPAEKVREILMNSDIFVDLSTYQAFGRSGIEAMASGCVPILPVEGGVNEYAINGENSFVIDTLDYQNAADKIAYLIDFPNELHDMKASGLQTAKKFNIRGASFSELLLFMKVFNENKNDSDNTNMSLGYKFSTRKNGCPSGSAYVRILSPLDNCDTKSINLNKLKISKNNLDSLMVDTVITHRDAITPEEVKRLKSRDVKVIYDLDDDLIDIKPCVAELISLADLVTVTNNKLKKKLVPLNNRIEVIPNYIDKDLWFQFNKKFFNTKKISEQRKIGYIGTPSHISNLNHIEENIKRFIDDNKFKLTTTFEHPVSEELNIRVDNYPNYIKELYKKTNEIMFAIAPLEINEFNIFKSYLKYLEYTALGLPAVFTSHKDIDFNDVIIHEQNGLLSPDNHNWDKNLKRMMNKELRKSIINNARHDIEENHLMSIGVKKWIEVIKSCYH
ncbi:glycosyltransferase [Haloplasma contractile]|uniref:Glycosyl transferase family 2 protein n=1 Tax=Haloplasma contractile SSD-17B TaxID=1033810 RepID=U2DR65_9MOLU|nr:glycosyltransferase [Haloplasma contractile]ERJ11062.1 Glycosyl transferase family 2 protein [Haloplasma contractile SSD-17B]